VIASQIHREGRGFEFLGSTRIDFHSGPTTVRLFSRANFR